MYKGAMDSIFAINNEPIGAIYRRLIDFAQDYCDTILLVVRDTIDMHPTAEDVLHNLEKYLKTKERKSEWPGTKLYSGKSAIIYQFNFCLESASIIKEATDRLYGWEQPKLPEDLCLLRPDSRPWLITVAHEMEGYLIIADEERRLLNVTLPEINLQFLED